MPLPTERTSAGIVHFCGRMFRPDDALERALGAMIADRLEQHGAVAGFGALACGADILVAEALLARGSELNVVLASSRTPSRARRCATAARNGCRATAPVSNGPPR